MIPAMMIDTLKPYVEKGILYGDFLISTNRFSNVLIRDLNSDAARKLVRDILTGFWVRYLEKNEGNYLLVSIEQFEEISEDNISPDTIAKEVADAVNNPRLHFEKVLVDSDSFEVFIEEGLQDFAMMIFVESSVPHDLLVAACKHLRALGYTVKGIIASVEKGQNGGTEIRHDLQIEYIPFIVYEEQKDKLYTITEIKEEPYLQYHPYFSP